MTKNRIIQCVLALILGCFFIFAASSCSKIKHKWANFWNGNAQECNIGDLYPELANHNCVGARENGLFYNYWFRYKATPEEVETALMAKPCHYTEIVPDSTLRPYRRDEIEQKFGSLPQAYFAVFIEWKVAPEDHLLYYRCTRTSLDHLLVFDTVSGYVYHKISEFRE